MLTIRHEEGEMVEEGTPNSPGFWKNAWGSFFELLKVLLFAAVIIIPVKTFFFQPFFVEGASMEPSFFGGDYLIVNEFGYKTTDIRLGDTLDFSVRPFRELLRFDAVVFRYPRNPSQYFIKRVIGLPGETVQIKDSRVTIYNKEHPNGFALDDHSYLLPRVITTDMAAVELKPKEYFVLGDNRQNSYDSRVIGPIPENKIIGKVLMRMWPLPNADVY
ncbi:MAG: signal peptidase I [Candidatus Moraniibacteriota bacterium]